MRLPLLTTLLMLLTIPLVGFAQNNLVNLPIGETDSFNDYINAIYVMFISIAALIAVVKIIIAGVKYMFTDIVTQKGEAKKDIQSALLGLLIVMSAVLILFVINPDLTTFDPEITTLQPPQPNPDPFPDTTPSEDAGTIISEANDEGGRAWVVASLTEERVEMCENINRDQCESQGHTSLHCYEGNMTELSNGDGVCVVEPENNIYHEQTLLCSVTTDDNDGGSCLATGICTTYNIDCANQIQQCEDAGMIYRYANSLIGSGLSDRRITCLYADTPNDSFDCVAQGQGQFNCSAAVLECQAFGKTPSITPGVNELVTVSSISCDD